MKNQVLFLKDDRVSNFISATTSSSTPSITSTNTINRIKRQDRQLPKGWFDVSCLNQNLFESDDKIRASFGGIVAIDNMCAPDFKSLDWESVLSLVARG